MAYLEDVYPEAIVERRPFNGNPYAGRDAMGYGRKIPMDYAVRIGSRWHRVYVCIVSNIGTCYVRTKDHPFLIIPDYRFPD